MKKLYFAFGSNMLRERIEQRVGKVTYITTYGVNGWRLVFNAGSDKKAFANMVKSTDYRDHVMGVLYELTSTQMRILDQHEGCPHLYTRMVVDRYKRAKDVFAYVSINPDYTQQASRRIQPARDYVELMIAGYEQNYLPKEAELLRSTVLPLAAKGHGVMW